MTDPDKEALNLIARAIREGYIEIVAHRNGTPGRKLQNQAGLQSLIVNSLKRFKAEGAAEERNSVR